MLGGWSSTIDPIQLADKGARLTGELPLKGMRRLVEMCRDEQGAVAVDLQFAHDPVDNLRTMHGRLSAQVSLTCQRCMGELDMELVSEPRLLLLRPGEREDLNEDSDVLVVERPVMLGELVEDELLLEVPMVPMHALDECPARDVVAAGETEKKQETDKKNPFAVLEELKRRDR